MAVGQQRQLVNSQSDDGVAARTSYRIGPAAEGLEGVVVRCPRVREGVGANVNAVAVGQQRQLINSQGDDGVAASGS